MFRPVRLTPPWLLHGFYPGQQPTARLRRHVQPIWAIQPIAGPHKSVHRLQFTEFRFSKQ